MSELLCKCGHKKEEHDLDGHGICRVRGPVGGRFYADACLTYEAGEPEVNIPPSLADLPKPNTRTCRRNVEHVMTLTRETGDRDEWYCPGCRGLYIEKAIR